MLASFISDSSWVSETKNFLLNTIMSTEKAVPTRPKTRLRLGMARPLISTCKMSRMPRTKPMEMNAQ